MIRVLLADDQTLVRSGFRVLLERTDDVEVVGEAADGDRAVAQERALDPDVVLMNVRMPVMDGLETTRRIASSRARVIMLTTFGLDEYVFEALHAGASGLLLKDVEPVELRHAVRVVAAGEALLSPSVDAPADRRVRDPPGPGPASARAARRADRPRARGDGSRRRRAEQRRDRRASRDLARDGQDAPLENPARAELRATARSS